MPYAPGVADQSGQILAQSIGQIAQQFAQSQDKLRLTDAEVAHLKSTVDFAAQKNILSPEELQQFTQGNLSKKREIASLAGMKYKDWQDQQDRATISPEMAAELKASGYLAAPMGGGRFQYLQTPGETPQQTPEVQRMLQEAGVIPVNTGRGRVDFITPPQRQEPFQFDPARDVVPLPGGGSFVRTSPSGGGNIMPGNAQSAFDPATALRTTIAGREVMFIPDGRGGMRPYSPPGAASGTVAKPMDMTTATTYGSLIKAAEQAKGEIARIDKDVAEQLKEIAAGDKRTGFVDWKSRDSVIADLNKERDAKAIELKEATAKIFAMRPSGIPQAPQAAPVRAAAPKASPKAATVKPSAGDRSKFAGPVLPALPESDALPAAEPAGEVLPPLPDTEEPAQIKTAEDYFALPSGAKFYDLNGNIRQKK
jgi:hypothetical protein